MTWILRLFSFRALLEFAARVRLGSKLWDLVVGAVDHAEAMEGLPGEQKFKVAFERIVTEAKRAALDYSVSLINWAIETAVRLIKER